jgi:hypothetical protein
MARPPFGWFIKKWKRGETEYIQKWPVPLPKKSESKDDGWGFLIFLLIILIISYFIFLEMWSR